MTGLDTNVLLRALTLDDPDQARRATELLQATEERRETLFVNVVVLCELAWTLRGRQYGYSREEIADTLATLLDLHTFEIQHRDQVKAAIRAFRSGKADFADYLIGELNTTAGCRSTATLDQVLRQAPGFHTL